MKNKMKSLKKNYKKLYCNQMKRNKLIIVMTIHKVNLIFYL